MKSDLQTKNEAVIYSEALLSFKNVTNNLLNGKIDENLETERLASKVLIYIKKHKEAFLSDLIEEFKVEPNVMIKIIKLLKERKLIRRTE